MCVDVYTYMYMYTRVCVSMCVHVYICVCVQVCTCISVNVCMHERIYHIFDSTIDICAKYLIFETLYVNSMLSERHILLLLLLQTKHIVN